MSWREVITDIDIYVSSLFYDNGHFVLEKDILGNLIRKGIPELIVLSAVIIFVVWLYGKKKHKVVWKIDNKIMLLTFGTMFLGPILIVNGIFKSFWGRARPQDVLQFGGNKMFTLPFEMSNQCAWDCSFMSGHTAIGFWVFCFAYLVPCRYRVGAMVFALLFGSFLGLARIAQGLHFFSDVFFAAVITISVIVWLHYKLFPEDYKKC